MVVFFNHTDFSFHYIQRGVMDHSLYAHRRNFVFYLTTLLIPHDCILCKNSVSDFYKTGLIPIAWLDVLFYCTRSPEQFDVVCALLHKTYEPQKKHVTKLMQIDPSCTQKQKIQIRPQPKNDQPQADHAVCYTTKAPSLTYDDMMYSLEHIINRIVKKACKIVCHPSGYKVNASCLQKHIESIFPKHRLVIDTLTCTTTLYDENDRRIFIGKLPHDFSPIPVSYT